jgi:hypothetical protein
MFGAFGAAAWTIRSLGWVVLTGCVSAAGVARTRAANDFQCREDQIQITEIGGTSFRATGCDRSEVYDCSGSSLGANGRCGVGATNYVCVPEGAKKAVADDAPSDSAAAVSDGPAPTADNANPNLCARAFRTIGDLTTAWSEWHPERGVKTPPSRDEFLLVCKDLSAKQQMCLLMPHGRQYRSTCAKTLASMAPDVAARLDDLFLQP